MAMVNVSAGFGMRISNPPLSSSLFLTPMPPLLKTPTEPCQSFALAPLTRRPIVCGKIFMMKEELPEAVAKNDEELDLGETRETHLHSFNPLPLLYVASLLPGAGTVRSLFGPFVELVKSFNLPDWLVHWGHPGNMAVVLFAMGGYGTYLGFRIRYSDDVEEKALAKDLHPKLLAGMFFFFALGATGGVTSLLTSDKPIFESPHAVTGSIGLALLTIQTILPSLFEGNPGLRNIHGILGSGIMTLFLIHAALGLQLGLSY
ncbi:Di-heme cytochrome, transmembrane [Quillaja saponaria]|uniref:Di-heme cytochrome, transmembrane n=1 Tax=Quillaja saponaria TaxID=32244 RepID=A0AAD7VID7_QUISA|nr:Di-heme cytochrome, transmembrane [Quillaja saponaria]